MSLLKKILSPASTLFIGGWLALANPNISAEPVKQNLTLEKTVQAPEIIWEKKLTDIYRDDESNSAQYIEETNQGEYLLSGITFISGNPSNSVVPIIGLDANGNMLGEYFSGSQYNNITPLHKTRDEDYVFGHSGSSLYSNPTHTFRKIAPGGSPILNIILPENTFSGGFFAQGLDDGKYLLSGSSITDEIALLKLDEQGQIESGWPRNLGVPIIYPYYFEKVNQGFLIGTGPKTTKINTTGNLIWDKDIEIWSEFAQEINDNYYFVGGDTISKTDTEGNVLQGWPKTYTAENWGALNCIRKRKNTVVVSGNSCLAGLDFEGNVLWTKRFQENYGNKTNSFQVTHDNGIITAGFTKTTSSGDPDMYIIRLDGSFPTGEDPIEIEDPFENIAGKNNLAVITHGWSLFDPLVTWPTTMANNIRNNLNSETDKSDWNITPYYWRKDSLTPLPNNAIEKGKIHGRWLGNKISEAQYNHVHLIGHSAGAWVVNEAAKKIKENKPDTTIQITFLDPYARLFEENQLGKTDYTDYAENYFNEDTLTGFLTDNLPNAHNIDLEILVPSSQPSHSYPQQWYNQTTYDSTTTGSDIYGFTRSLEGGGQTNWNESLNLERGNETLRIKRQNLGNYLIGENIQSQSLSGEILQTATGIDLNTTSMQPTKADLLSTTSYANTWFEERIQIGNANTINFNYEFTGDGRGYVSAYFNNNLILLDDQLVSDDKLNNSGNIYIGDMTANSNTLGIRLDNLSQTNPASISISDLNLIKTEWDIPHTNSKIDWNLFW